MVASGREWDVEIRHQVAIAGRVTNAQDGRAIQGAQVEISSAPTEFVDWLAIRAQQYPESWERLSQRPDRTRTAVDGHFHFLDLPDGQYTLTVSLPDSGSKIGTTEVQASVSRSSDGKVNMAVADTALSLTTITGQLTDFETGVPVTLAEISMRGDEGSVLSNNQGQYSLSGVQIGEDHHRTVVVSAQGYETAYQDVLLSQAGQIYSLDVALVASDFDPTMITGNLIWLRADAIVGLNDNDAVTAWPDGSGNGNHAIQINPDSMPTYKQSVINGMPVVRFDGQADFMEFSFTELSTDHTFFFVYDQTLGPQGNYFFDAQSGRLRLYTAGGAGNQFLRWHDGSAHRITQAISGKQIVAWLFSGNTGEIFRNGSSLGTDDYTPRFLGGNIALGANDTGHQNFFEGDLAEVIYYNRALSPTEREKIERYLGHRYAITLSD